MTSADWFEYTVQHDTDRSVVALSGELDYYSAQSVAPSSFDGDSEVVVFDLGNLDFIDASGLRRLLELRASLQRQGKQVEFKDPSRAVSRVTELLDIDLTGEKQS